MAALAGFVTVSRLVAVVVTFPLESVSVPLTDADAFKVRPPDFPIERLFKTDIDVGSSFPVVTRVEPV